MPWFYCDDCGDSIKKPKVAAHCRGCSACSFTCIDCSRQFDQRSVHMHTKCVTEHEKYAEGATKPGGFASKGFYGDGGETSSQGNGENGTVMGEEFLSQRAPWKCSVCNVTCTSQDTLMAHAAGSKHVRKSKGALAARKQQAGEGGQQNGDDGVTIKKDEIKNGSSSSDKENSPNENKELEVGKSKSKKTEIDTNSEQKTNGDKRNSKMKAKDVKLKKLAKAELKRSGGSLKQKSLIKAILKAVKGLGDIDSKDVIKKLQKSSKFSFEGKTVRLKK